MSQIYLELNCLYSLKSCIQRRKPKKIPTEDPDVVFRV